MSAIVTDQFRILNANNFVESVENTNNSYYLTKKEVSMNKSHANPINQLITNQINF